MLYLLYMVRKIKELLHKKHLHYSKNIKNNSIYLLGYEFVDSLLFLTKKSIILIAS